MTRYMPDIDGPEFFTIYIDMNGVEAEVEAFVTKAATGEEYNDNGMSGWLNTTDPEFVFEGFEDDGTTLLIFTKEQMQALDDVANDYFWKKVGE